MKAIRQITFSYLRFAGGLLAFSILSACFLSSCKGGNEPQLEMEDLFPWCIVAYDSPERSPEERIAMIKELGFDKYAYDWRDRHLESAASELILARENDIEVNAIWVWLNAKQDSVGQLSEANEKLFAAMEEAGLQSTVWMSMSENFFRDMDEDQAFEKAVEIVGFVAEKAEKLGCDLALYNHGGWFGDPLNQLKVLKALPEYELSLVYNFHHGHHSIDNFPELIDPMLPYLSAVNLNGMEKDGQKILPIGQGEYEKDMIQALWDAGYRGPWGILGHVEDADVKVILEENLKGLELL